MRSLTSDFAIGAGTTLALRDANASPNADGVWEMNQELRPGNSYTALVYDPKPSPIEMRAAGTAYPPEADHYAGFTLTGGRRRRPVDRDAALGRVGPGLDLQRGPGHAV